MKITTSYPKGNIAIWGDVFHHVTGSICSAIATEEMASLKNGIKPGSKIFFDFNIPYNSGQVSCFYDPNLTIVISSVKRNGYKYLGKLVNAYHE